MILENEHSIFKKVYLKYLILKIRAKISYMAFAKRMTIVELFATTILRCYNEQKKCKLSFQDEQFGIKEREQDKIFRKMLDEESQGFLLNVVKFSKIQQHLNTS